MALRAVDALPMPIACIAGDAARESAGNPIDPVGQLPARPPSPNIGEATMDRRRFLKSAAILSTGLPAMGRRAMAAGEPDPFRLPDWFEKNRVQAHSEHGIELALRLTPQGHARVIRNVGAEVLTRIYLTRDEGAWWPSRVGDVHPLVQGRDFAREISDAVHATGMKVIAYHRHMSDAAMQREHPDWVCRLPNGSPYLEPRGKTKTVFVLCLNSPYREYIKTRLVELADRGVDGIYFDNRHMPDVCTCEYCLEKYRRQTGHEMNYQAPAGSADYLAAVEFVNRSMVEAFLEWREAVHRRHPEVFFCVKSSQYPMFFSPHIDYHLLAVSDTSGTEFHKPFGHRTAVMRRQADFAEPAFDDQVALGWSIVRDGSAGRPPLMWIPFIRSEEKSLYSAAAAVTYGGVAAMNMRIRDLEKDGPRNAQIFRSTFAMGRRVSPYLAYARPIPWAALHVSERSRNQRLPDRVLMWREVFAPALGAFQVLKESHLPWVTLSDLALSRPLDPRTRLLVLPWPQELTDKQQAVVRQFASDGGQVIRLDPAAGWETKTKKPGLMVKMAQSIRQQAAKPPIAVAGPPAMHAVSYRQAEQDRLVVSLANTWGWFRSTRDPNPKLNEGTPPPACQDVTVTFSPEFGKPRRVFEAVTETELPPVNTPDGWRATVPEFQTTACVVAEY
jgi:hypothetical protein